MPEKTMTSVDALLAQAGVKTAEPAPPKVPEPPKDGYQGSILAGDGRMLHKYIIDGEQVLLPKKQEEMTPEDFYQVANLSLANPLLNRIPQTLTVKFRDPQWSGYWFNRKAGDGKSVRRGKSLGFIPATKEDLDWYPAALNDDDGAIIDGDLVLMKISKIKLYANFLIGYFDEARKKGGVDRYKHEAENMTGPNKMVSHYLTPQAKGEYQGIGPVVNLQTVS